MAELKDLQALVNQYRTELDINAAVSAQGGTPIPQEPEFNLHRISDDPNAPLIKIPKNASPEDVEKYLQSDELASQIFDQGYLYLPGVPSNERPPAQKIEAPTMEEKGDFRRNLENALGLFPDTVQSIKNIYGQITGDEQLQSESKRIIELYNLKNTAKQFYTDDQGEIRPYGNTLREIVSDEGSLSDYIDWGQGALGNISATLAPIFAATYAGGALAGPYGATAGFLGTSYLMAIGAIRPEELETTDNPNLVKTLTAATLYSALDRVGISGKILTTLTKKFGKETAEKEYKNATESFIKKYGKGFVSGAGTEYIAESGQTAIEQTAGEWQKAQSLGEGYELVSEKLKDPEVLKTIEEAGYQGAFGGGVVGGAINVISKDTARNAYENNKKFEGKSFNLANTNTNDPTIEPYKNKKVTISTVNELRGRDNEILTDKDGNPITPTFEIIGTTEIEGEKYITLFNTSQVPNDVPSIFIPAKDAPNLINIYEEPKPVEKTEVIEEAIPEGPTVTPSQQAQKEKRKLVGVTPEQAEAIQVDMRKGMSFDEAVKKNAPTASYVVDFNPNKPNKPAEVEVKDEPETFVSYNKNSVNAAERRLNQRGFNKKVLNDIKKNKNAADDIMSLDSDETNYIDDLRNELEKLNYYKGPEGIARIDALQADISKGKRGKTRGREQLEDIVKNKVAFQPVEIVNKYRTGETVVPPLSKDELRSAGYSVAPLKYNKTDYEKDILNSNNELTQTTDPNQREIIQNRIRYLNSLYNLSNKPLKNRYNQLKAMVTGKGYLFRDKQINQIKDLPAELRGVEQAIEGTTNNPFIEAVAKEVALNDLNNRRNNILQDKSDFDTLLISLGADETFTLNDLSKVSMSGPIINKITYDVLGKTIPKFETETTRLWSLQGPSPKMLDEFKGDLPKLRQQLINELQRLMGLGTTDLKIVDEFLANSGEALNGGFLIDFATVDVATRMRTIAAVLNSGVPFEQALLVVPQAIPQNKIIISAKANEPFAVELKQDPRLFTLHHETMHALMLNGFFTKEETSILKEAARKYWIKQYDISGRPGSEKLTQEQLEEEAIANAFAAYLANKYQPRGMIATLLYRLKAYINALSNVLLNNNYYNANKIFEEVDLGNVKKRKYDAEIQDSLDLSYRNAAYKARMKIKELRNRLETSAVKGGTPENIGMVGTGTQNQAANILLNSPFVKPQIDEIINQIPSSELSLAASKLIQYINNLAGDGNATGLPEADNIIAMETLITDIRNLLADMDYLNFDNTLPAVADVQLTEAINNVRNTFTTPLQRDAVNALSNLLSENTLEKRQKTIALISNLFTQGLTAQNVALSKSPSVMYHGTTEDFETFSKYKDFYFHVGTLEAAKVLLTNRTGPKKYIKELFVDIKNPLRMRDLGSWDAPTVLSHLTVKPDMSRSRLFERSKMSYSIAKGEAIIDTGGISNVQNFDLLEQRIFTPDEYKRIILEMNKATRKFNEEKVKVKSKTASQLDDPYDSASSSRNIDREYKLKIEQAHDRIIVKEIKKKGYDGIVYLNMGEASEVDGGPRDSYIAFDGSQLINSSEFSAIADLGSPIFRASVSMGQDPSATDSPKDKFPELNRQQENESIRTVDKLIQDYTQLHMEGSKRTEDQQIEDMGKFNKIFSHVRIWSDNNPIFTPLYQTVQQREQFSARLQFEFQKKLHDNFIPAMRDTQTNINITKALEISSQVEGIYRPDRPISEGGRITFIAKQDGKGAGSTVKKGDVVILEGDAAQAYMDVQAVLQTANKEIIRGLIANENIKPMIEFAINVLKINRPDLAEITIGDNPTPVLSYTKEQMENIEYDELKFIVDALNDPSTYLQPSGRYSRELAESVSQVLSKDIIERAADGSILNTRQAGTGLNALLKELATYKRFKQSDYIPLQRYGNYFIAVKDADGNLLEYRMFNKGKFGTKFLDEEASVRKQLQNKYPNLNIENFTTQKVDIDNLRKGVAADLGHMDSIAQFLSDLNANNYINVRKELDTLINKKVGADVRGYGVFLQPRKEQGGVPGFSTDFGRAITQYLTVSAGFAGKNRYKSTELRMLNDVKQSGKQNLKEAVGRWYEYSDSPHQEYALPRRLGFWWYLGGNASSALLQTMSIPQFVWSKLSTFSNSAIATQELVIALNDVRKMMALPLTEKFKNRQLQDIFVDFSEMPSDVQELILDVANGILKPGSSFKETGMPTDQANYTSTNKFRHAIRTAENSVMGGMFASFETMARLSSAIAVVRVLRKYPKALKKAHKYFSHSSNYRYNVELNGGETSPRIIMQQVIMEDFGVYGKTERPQIMRGMGAVVFLFNTYVAQMISQLYRNMFERGLIGKEIAAKTLAMIIMTGGIFASPFFDDAAWLAEFLYNRFTGLRVDRRQVYRRYLDENGWGAGAIEALENGLVNKWLDFDLASRTRFNVPGVQQFKALLNLAGFNSGARGEEALGAFGSLVFGNARNIVNNISQAGGITEIGFDDAFKIAMNAMPTFVKNFVASADYFTGGPIFSSRGTLLIDDPSMYEGFLKSIGFNPTDITKAQNLLYLEQVNGGVTSEIRSRFNTRIKNYYRDLGLALKEKDKKAKQKDLLELQKIKKEITDDLIKLNQNLKPGLKFVPDVYRLMQEAAKDLDARYRISSGSSYEIGANLYDYQLLNKSLIPANPD